MEFKDAQKVLTSVGFKITCKADLGKYGLIQYISSIANYTCTYVHKSVAKVAITPLAYSMCVGNTNLAAYILSESSSAVVLERSLCQALNFVKTHICDAKLIEEYCKFLQDRVDYYA
jgi:hypothetical protein